jgi:hypothetical protein
MSTEFRKACIFEKDVSREAKKVALFQRKTKDYDDYFGWLVGWLAGGSEDEGKTSDGCDAHWSAPRHSTMTSFASSYFTSLFLLFTSVVFYDCYYNQCPYPPDVTSAAFTFFLRFSKLL